MRARLPVVYNAQRMSEPSEVTEQPPWVQRIQATAVEMATADPRTLGLFRICFGSYLLVDLYRRLPDYVLFLTNEGMLPAHASIYRPMSPYLFSLFHAAHSRAEVLGFLGLTAFVYTCYLVGYRTRLFQVLALLAVSSLHSRNIMIENGGDVVANLFAVWTLFLPLGARFSVDALQRSLAERHEKRPSDLNDRQGPVGTTSPFVSLAYAAAIWQCAAIYYFNVIHKDGIPWRTGVTVHYVLWSDRLIQPLGVWLRGFVPPLGIYGMTVGTLVIEASIATLLFSPILVRPCRRVAALLVIALHAGFQTVGHFGMFSFVMMLHAPLLMGPEDWEALSRRWRPRLASRVVVYDADCGVCFFFARLLKRLDAHGRIRFVPNDDPDQFPASVDAKRVEDSIVVTDEAGTLAWEEEAAVGQILRCLPFGVLPARLIELPGCRTVVRALYRGFAVRRKRVSEALGYGACGVPLRIAGHDASAGTTAPIFFRYRVAGILRALMGGVMVLAVGTQLFYENRGAPRWLKPQHPPRILLALAEYPRCFQGWSMFAPIPPLDDGSMVIDALTADGRHVDPTRDGGPVDFNLADADHGLLVSQFWYELADRIRRDGNARFREYFRDWLLAWQRTYDRPAGDRIVSFDAYWISRPTQPPGQKARRPTSRYRFLSYPETDSDIARRRGAVVRPAKEEPSPTPPLPTNGPVKGLPDPSRDPQDARPPDLPAHFTRSSADRGSSETDASKMCSGPSTLVNTVPVG